MKKTKEDTITIDEYDRYPWWFDSSALRLAMDRGEINHIELVKTTLNTTGHRLYKVVTNIGNVYTVKVETTFKATPLENFINAIINGMSDKCAIRIPSIERAAQAKRLDDARFEAYRKGYRDGQIDTFHTLSQGEEVMKQLKEDKR